MKALIHKSELDIITKYVLDYPQLETGGDFFGLWTKEGFPVVQFVLGPGKKTTRSSTSFYQDIDYLKECGLILNGKYGLEHIGAWHSHHHLSLAHPSSGDVNTMRNALRDGKIPQFLISICNINNDSDVSINGFLFSNNFNQDYIKCNWKILEGISSIRESISKNYSKVFIMPEVNTNSSGKVRYSNNELPKEELNKHNKPVFDNNSYWLKDEGREYLKMVYEKLMKREDLTNVELLQLADSRIVISFRFNNGVYEIIFPNNFPIDPPEVIERIPVEDDLISDSIRKLFKSSRKRDYYIQKFIKSLNILDKNSVVIVKHS